MEAASLEKVTDLGTSPQAVARRWKLELKLASKREEAWRKKARDICKLYTPDNPMASSFNILWTNTETLRQACYNSLPQPKVRRRYNDEDPLGKAVSDVLTRALEFCQDAYDFDSVLKGDVLAMLLPGRAVSRVRYVPSLRQVGVTEDTHIEQNEEPTHEAQEGAYEEIDWEQVVVERVQWDDFRLSAARCWDDVCWVAFRHHLNREDLIEKFGNEIGNAVPLDSVADEDVKAQADMEMLFKTAEVWEIWDKDEQQVVWIATGYPKPVKTQADPLKLQGFFPCPRPLYAIEQHDTLVPAALFSQYEQQAKELNKISRRINGIVEALRVRGIYDATLTELGELMKAGDNELVPAANVTALLERGGLDKAIWMLPMETAAMVLRELYAQREATKQVIYEITGIADIMRASSDPAETFGAQKIKTQWGTQRLQRLQREVQRYIRDIVRIKAEIISEKFQPETLEKMTLVNMPHDADVRAELQQQLQQWQQAAMQAAQQGQPPPAPPQPPQVATWETCIDTMRNDAARTYHIDIETDSTLSASQDEDITGISQLMQGVTQLMQGLAPIVQAGVMPIEAVRELVLAAVRRARMGSAVEDALTKMQAPPPPSQDNTEAQKLQMQAQQHAAELQATAQLEQMKAQLSVEAERGKQQAQAEQSAQENQMQAEREMQKQQLQAEVDQRKAELDAMVTQQKMEFERWKAELEASTRIVIAEIGAGSRGDGTTEPMRPTTSYLGSMVGDAVKAANAEVVGALGQQMALQAEQNAASVAAMIEGMSRLVEGVNRPKRIVRGMDGRAVGVE
jgi:hypothetical protein